MTTILKLIGSGFGLWAAWLLWPEFLLLLVAILLAVTLHPAVAWMERRRIARGVSVAVIAAVALGLVALLVVFLLPPLTAQVTHLLQDVPAFRDRILSRIPARYPVIQAVIGEIFAWFASPKTITLFERSFAWGQSAVSGLVTAAIVFVVTLYLLLDGKSLYA
jgi:predicted PurR-regulated permease PerM